MLYNTVVDPKKIKKRLFMKKNRKVLIVLAVISGLLALAAAAVVCAVMLLPSVQIRLRTFYGCLAAVVVFSVLVVIFTCEALTNENAKKTIVKITMICTFAVYLIVYFGFLFLIKAYSNHDAFSFTYNRNWLKEALPGLIPLKSTAKMIYDTLFGSRAVSRTLVELGGNMFALVPFAFFLPAMFKGMRHFDSFLPTMVFISVATELFQGMFGLGSCEIDDFILGVGTACLVFYILRRPKIIKFLDSKHIYF